MRGPQMHLGNLVMALMKNLAQSGAYRRTMLLGFCAAACSAVLSAPAKALQILKGAVIGKDGWLFLVWDDPRKADYDHIRQVVKVVSDAVAIFKAANIDIVIALTPAKARLYREYLPDDFKFVPQTDARYKDSAAGLRKSGALVPDLEDAFMAMHKSSPETKIFFKADTHWTAMGAEYAAREIGRQMLDKLKLPPSPRPGTKLGKPMTLVHSENDLAREFPPAQRASYPPEPFQQTAPVSNGLLDDDRADVVVVGNSYMQPKFNFSPMLSNVLNRPVGLVWKVHTYGPYNTMLTYLQSAAFRKDRPRAIVWNFHEIDLELLPDSQSAWPQSFMSTEAFLTAVQAAVKKA